MKAKKIITGVIGLLLLASLIGCGKGGAVTQADAFVKPTEAASMHLRKTEGTVDINDANGTSVEARENLGLYSGYGVETQAASFAWVDLDSVKLTKLDEESRVKIDKDGGSLEINLESGNLFFHVTKPLGADESMEIRTSTMVLGIRGTCGWIEAEGEFTNVFLLEGKVEVESPAGTEKANVLAGEMAAVSNDGTIVVKQFDKDAIPAFVLDEADDDDKLKMFIEGMASEDYEERENFYLLKGVDSEYGTGISSDDEVMWEDGPFSLGESVDIYSNFNDKVGYTKPSIKADYIGRIKDWVWMFMGKDNFLVKAETFDKVAEKQEVKSVDAGYETDYTAQNNENNADQNSGNQTVARNGNTNQNTGNTSSFGGQASAQTKPQQPVEQAYAQAQPAMPMQPQTSVPVEQTPAPAPVEQTPPAMQTPAPAQSTGYKYTGEEAAAIFENGLRAAGMKKPEEVYTAEEIAMYGSTAGMSWGIDEIPLNDPQAAVTSAVTGFQWGGYNLYYIEYIGVENDVVKLKVYYG